MPKEVYKLKDEIEKPQSYVETMRAFFIRLKRDVKVMLPVKVISVDHSISQCDLQVMSKDTDDTGNIIDYPVLVNVPIRYTCETSSAFVRCPVQVGDTGTVEFFDSSIDLYKIDGLVEWTYDEDYHGLSDGIYTSGFYPEDNVFTPNKPDDPLIIGTKNGIFELRSDSLGNLDLRALTVDITALNMSITGNVSITGNLSVTGNISVTNNLVLGVTDVRTWLNAHIHPDPVSGVTGAPVVPLV